MIEYSTNTRHLTKSIQYFRQILSTGKDNYSKLNVDNNKIMTIDFVLSLGLGSLICNYLLSSTDDDLTIECCGFLCNACRGTPDQVYILIFTIDQLDKSFH